jgi:hypothetical protein
MKYYIKSFTSDKLSIIDTRLKNKALKNLLGLHKDYNIDIPVKKVVWDLTKLSNLGNCSVQVFIDFCFENAKIPEYML